MVAIMCSVPKLAVAAAYVVMIAFNALANTDIFSSTDQGELSNQNPTFLTPDGITFAVWGLIYLLEILLVIYQLGNLDEETEALLQKTFLGLSVRWRIVIAFVLNAAWLPVFNNKLFWVALVIILAYLVALIAVYRDLRPGNARNFQDAVCLTAGISANLSWVVVASCLNLFFCLGEAGWKDEYGVSGTPLAAIIVCVCVSVLAVGLVVQGKDMVYGFVAGWALQGIYRMQTFEEEARFPPAARSVSLATTAGALSAIVWVTVLSVAVILSYSACRSGEHAKGAAEASTTPAASPKEDAASAPEAMEAGEAVEPTAETTGTEL